MTSVSTPATSVSPEPVSKPQGSYHFQAQVDKKGLLAVGGKGNFLTVEDENGDTKELIDAITGAAVGALGWGDDAVVDFFTEAAKLCTYSYPVTVANKNAEALAKFYIDNSYPGAFAGALWLGSGSEANENAMKIAHLYHKELGQPQRTKFITRAISYHGFSIATMSISGNPRAKSVESILMPKTQCLKTEVCFPFRFKNKDESLDEYTDRLVKSFEELIVAEGPDTIASVILEPLTGSSIGTAPPPPNYLRKMREVAHKYGILFHLDEVMCGTGRCNPNGRLNCWENFLGPGEGPDIQTVGKTLGSGYVTIAGLLVSPKVKNAFVAGSGTLVGSHTYASHSINCFVALKIQERIKELGLTKNIFEVGNYLGQQLQEKVLPYADIVVDARGLGGFWSLELAKSKDTLECFDMSLGISGRVQKQCIKNGLNVMASAGCCGDKGDMILYAPSFVITKELADQVVEITLKSILEVTEQLKAEGLL